MPRSFLLGVFLLLLPQSLAIHCYQCRDVVKPQTCQDVVACDAAAGKTACFSEEVTDEHMVVTYNMGCTYEKNCGNITIPRDLFGRRGTLRRPVPRDLQLTTCFKCCHGDRCNDRFCDGLCENNPCQHGATCYSSRFGKGFSCSCAPGYTGKLCQTDVDECASSPCHNGGSCEDRVNGFLCHCPPRYIGVHCETDQKSCAAYFASGETKSGVYFLDLKDGQPGFQVFCDMDTQGGGWTVFQRRQDGSVDFYRGWQDYKTGFGDLTGEFWLGLDKIYRLNAVNVTALHVDLGDFANQKAFADYSHFSVGPESDSYRLSISGYSGTAGESMIYHNGYPFVTKDRDPSGCVDVCRGGWWYSSCYRANLNGPYIAPNTRGIAWGTFGGLYNSLKSVEMKMK